MQALSETSGRPDDAQAFLERLAGLPVHALPEVEADDAVPPYRRPLSASALKLFADCERKWFFRYLCNVVEDPGSSASTYGTALHDALEHLHKAHPAPLGVAAESLATDLRVFIDASFARYAAKFDSPLETELQRRRAQRSGERYLEWLQRRMRQHPFEVVGNETHTTLELEGFSFVGYIDRLDRDLERGTISVIDYKTGSIAETAAAYREDVAAFREFQLPFYYWSRTAAGDTVTRLALIPLKDPQLDVVPIELEIVGGYAPDSGRAARGAIGVAELEAARRRMIDLAGVLTRDTKSRFATTSNPDDCAYCAYLTACRTRPLPCQDPFGR